MIKPVINKFASDNEAVEIKFIDATEDVDATTDKNITVVPTLVVMTDGEETNRHSGIITYNALSDLIG
jgi:hypothetical protein